MCSPEEMRLVSLKANSLKGDLIALQVYDAFVVCWNLFSFVDCSRNWVPRLSKDIRSCEETYFHAEPGYDLELNVLETKLIMDFKR